jgi:hypothetical protein
MFHSLIPVKDPLPGNFEGKEAAGPPKVPSPFQIPRGNTIMSGSMLKTLVLLVALLSLGTGCASKSWKYDTKGQRLSNGRDCLLIAVVTPFDDSRPSITSETNSPLWLVPLIPWSTATVHHGDKKGDAGIRADADKVTPPSDRELALQNGINLIRTAEERERARAELDALRRQREGVSLLRSKYSFPDIIPATIADEILASGLTDEVVLVGSVREGMAQKEARPDLYITGKLQLVEENRETLSYGLTIAAPVLWLFLPARNVNYRVAYTVEVRDWEGNLLTTHTYRTAMDRSSHWIYGGAAFGHVYNRHLPGLVQRLNTRVVQDLADVLETFPPQYWEILCRRRTAQGAVQ